MKLLLLYLSTQLIMTPPGSFYAIKFEGLDGTLIKTSDYQGKKVVVAVVSGNAQGLDLVKYLDSVQKSNSSIQVVAIPTGEFNGKVTAQDLKNLKKNLSIVVSKPLRVKKSNGVLQHPLFSWLTNAKENQHFDMDVSGEGQVFVISAKGTLYSVLPNSAPRTILKEVINEDFKE